jgi:3-oxoacyl-[acyl-carrier-protein] synthase-3
MVDTTDEWIVERTGIRSRYIAADGETTATLATDAARKALDACRARRHRHRPDRARHRDSRPDLPVVGDQGPGALGINDCIAFDVHAVCTGFLYALSSPIRCCEGHGQARW